MRFLLDHWVAAGGAGTRTLTIRVTDDGLPPKSDAETIRIVVVSRPSSSGSYAIFAGASEKKKSAKLIYWKGRDNTVVGRIHSNLDICRDFPDDAPAEVAHFLGLAETKQHIRRR